MITHLQETWKIQNKLTYSSTRYYNHFYKSKLLSQDRETLKRHRAHSSVLSPEFPQIQTNFKALYFQLNSYAISLLRLPHDKIF